MFITIKSKKQLISRLNKLVGEEIVFYYYCKHCNDIQISESIKIEEQTIDFLKKTSDFTIDLECEKCGFSDTTLTENFVQGIEIC